MEFTYTAYTELIKRLKENGYIPRSYHDWQTSKKCVIMRHDIDNDINKAVLMAELEFSLNIKSTYFVLLTSDFYNLLSHDTKQKIMRIKELNHEIGLHFDEVQYPNSFGDIESLKEKIIFECKVLESIIETPVRTVSMHRPSKKMLEADLKIPGIVNSYGKTFFHDFKYLSDSRRRWREPIEEIIDEGCYNRLHVLTHAFWYDQYEHSIEDAVFDFINRGSKDRYISMKSNITDLEAIVPYSSIIGGQI